MPDRPLPGVARRLFGARLTASLMPLNSTMVAVAVPDVARQLGHSVTTVTQALVATYLITAIALQSPGGKLGDRHGPWLVVTVGQVAIAAGAVLGLLARDLAVLTVARMLIACGGALAVPATVALLRLELPPDQRGRAFGTFGALMGLAAAVGPLLGGVLVDAFSWHAVFLANLPLLAVAAVVAGRGPVRVPTTTAAPRFDWSGSGLLTVALALVVVGAQGGRPSSLVALLTGLALLGVFGWWERRAQDPVVDLRLFRSVPFAAGSSLIALQNLVMYAVLFALPLVLDRLFGLGARDTGQLLVWLTVAMVVTSLVAGRLVDRAGARPVAITGALLCVAGLVVLERSGLSSPEAVRLPLVLLGGGVGLSSPAAQTASLSSVARAQSGMAAGVSSTMRYLGAVVGIALLARGFDPQGSRAEVLADVRALFAVFAVALLVSLLCAALLPRRAARELAPPSVRTS